MRTYEEAFFWLTDARIGQRLFFFSQSGKVEGEERMGTDFLVQKSYENAAGKPMVSSVEVKSPMQ